MRPAHVLDSRAARLAIPAPRVNTEGTFAGADAGTDRRSIGHVLMTTDAVGGVWRYSIDLGRAFGRRGVRTTLAVMGPPPDEAQRQEANRAGLAVLDRPYRLEWMEEPWADVERAGAWLLALERGLRPDIVHLNGYAHAALPWTRPTVVVAHSCVRTWWRAVNREAAPPRLDRYQAVVAQGLAAARMVVAPTAAKGDALAREYGLAMRPLVIPNACAEGDAPSEPIWADKEPIVLTAGRAWDHAKNIAALCAVASRIAWPIHVAGSQREPEGQDCPLPGVRALGCLSPGELSAWFRRASIYALPARYEPFGLSVLEAARAGCALVLGEIASLRENWETAAVFVAPDDTEGLASVLQELIEDEQERLDRGKRAFASAAAFSIDRTAGEYLRVYEGLMA